VDTFKRKQDATPGVCESPLAAALKAKTKKVLDEKAAVSEQRRAYAERVAALAPVRAWFVKRLERIARTPEALQLRAYLQALSEDHSSGTIGLKFSERDLRYIPSTRFVPSIYFSKEGFCIAPSVVNPKLMPITKMQDSELIKLFHSDKRQYFVELADDCESWLLKAIQKVAKPDFAPVGGCSDYEWFASATCR